MKYVTKSTFLFVVLVTIGFLSSCASIGLVDSNVSPSAKVNSQIALMLPVNGKYKNAGRAIRDGFLAGYYSHQQAIRTNSTIRIYDTSRTKNISKLYSKSIKDGAQIVVGPLIKSNVRKIKARMSLSLPTIALNYVNSEQRSSARFFQFGISPENEANQVSQKARNAGYSKVIIIAPKNNWGNRIANYFSVSWLKSGGEITDALYYKQTQDLRSEVKRILKIDESDSRARILEKTLHQKISSVFRRRQDVDVIFLVALPQVARTIIPLLRFYYAGNVPIYTVSLIYGGIARPNYYRDMDGVVFCDMPWILEKRSPSSLLQATANELLKPSQNYMRLYALGLDAYMLALNLDHLPNSAQLGIRGATGALYLGKNQQILQVFEWARFKKGVPTRLVGDAGIEPATSAV